MRFLHRLYIGWLCNGRTPTRHFRAFPTLVIRRLVRQQTPSDSTLSVRSYTGYTSAGSATDALRLDTFVRFLHRLYVSWFDNERPLTRHYLCVPTLVIRWLVRQQTPSDSTLSVRSYTGYTSAGSATDALRLDTFVRFLHRLYVSWFDNERPLTRHYLCVPTLVIRWLVRQWTPSDSTLPCVSYTGYTSAGLTMDALRLDTICAPLQRLLA